MIKFEYEVKQKSKYYMYIKSKVSQRSTKPLYADYQVRDSSLQVRRPIDHVGACKKHWMSQILTKMYSQLIMSKFFSFVPSLKHKILWKLDDVWSRHIDVKLVYHEKILTERQWQYVESETVMTFS